MVDLEIFLLARLFRTGLLRTQAQHMSCRAASSRTFAETHYPHLKSKLIFVLFQIFAPDAGSLSALEDDLFTCLPHPYHFPSSRLHRFLVARAKSRSTLFLQAALRSQICSYFISAMSLPQLDRLNLCEKLSTAALVSWTNSSVQMGNAIFFSVHFHGLSRPTVLSSSAHPALT